jgi:hypothetical protein
MMSKRLSALILGLGLTLAPAAQAQETESATRSAARSLGMSGVEAYQAGRYDQASDELEKAYGILRAPTLGLWSARALVKQKKLLEAAERYLETSGLQIPTGDTAIQKKAIEDAKSELAALRPTIPSLRIKVVGARASEVQVSIDGVQIASGLLTSPRLVNPGTHEVVGERAGQQVRGSATLSEGQSQDIELRFGSTQAVAAERSSAAHNAAPGPQTAPNEAGDVAPAVGSSRKTWAVVALAAGGAGLVVGGVTGGLAVDLKGELDSSGDCPNGCFISRQADVDRLNLYRSVSTVGFIAGGVLAATGVVLWITAPKTGSATARAGLGPTGMVLEGTF